MVERKKLENFEDLIVWQKGVELVKQMYLLTAEGKLKKDFGLRDQLQRAYNAPPFRFLRTSLKVSSDLREGTIYAFS